MFFVKNGPRNVRETGLGEIIPPCHRKRAYGPPCAIGGIFELCQSENF
jgi:hypothetical protein